MQRVTPYCNASIQDVLEGFDNAYQYLCTEENTRAYLGNQSCYGKVATKEMVKDCNRTFISQLLTLHDDQQSSVKIYCGLVDEYIDCLSSGLTHLCNSKAAKWQNEWIRNLREPDMMRNKCPGWVAEDSSGNAWATALMICLVITTTLMIVGILALTFFIIRKRYQLRRNQTGTSSGSGNPDAESTPQPPPYSIVVETPGADGQPQAHLVDSQSAPGDNHRVLGASSPAHKRVILPPPYVERPDDEAPPYDTIANETMGTVNNGFLDDKFVVSDDNNGLTNPRQTLTTESHTSEA